MGEVKRIEVKKIEPAFQQELLEIVRPYYQNAESGLEKELKFGNFVYFLLDDKSKIGAFLIVGLNHAKQIIEPIPYVFTYLGLGCAKRQPMIPIFDQVKQ